MVDETETDFHRDVAERTLRYLGRSADNLTKQEKSIIELLAGRQAITRDTNESFDETLTPGQRLADKVAEFGGSWTFIIVFALILAAWVIFNVLAAVFAFDPYPFIFLNLVLSMLAAVQAPVIMMSQNRQAAKDRLNAAHDYEVNLKAEIEIMALHEKLDHMRANELRGLIQRQQEQLELLTKIVMGKTNP